MLIDRFITKEILITSGLAIITLCVVLVLGNVAKDAFDLLLNRGVPLMPILRFIVCALPFCLVLAIPWGFLTAVLLVFGRMAADRELFALHSVGVSITRICRPVFIIAGILCFLCFWINAELAPRARLEMRRILGTVALAAVFADSAPDQVINLLPMRRIYIGTQSGGHLGNIQIFELTPDSEIQRFVFAREGWMEKDEESEEMLIQLRDVAIDERKPENSSGMEKLQRAVSAKKFVYRVASMPFSHASKGKSVGSYTLRGLRAQIKRIEDNCIFRTEFHKRISLSLACFPFALVGVPLAVLTHRRETSIGFGIGLAIGLCYYAFLMFADNWRATPKAHPELLAWSSNIVFIPLGSLLFRRLARH